MNFKKSWSIKEQTKFLRLIGELLERGYPLSSAIKSISFQFPKGRQEDIDNCLRLLQDGLPLSEVLGRLNFKKDLVGYVFYAEAHGNYREALIKGSDITERGHKDFEKIAKLLYYPSFLIIFTILAFTIIEKLLLPRFLALFSNMQIEQNFFTILILKIAGLTPVLLFGLTILLILSLGFYFLKFKKLPPLKQKLLLLKIPIIGRFFRLFYTYYFSSQLSYLLSGGLSINESLAIFEKNDRQPFYQDLSQFIKTKLYEGENLEGIIKGTNFFEGDFANVLAHGQINGYLDKELDFYSQYCLLVLEERMNRLIKFIQPVLFILIGVLIVSMYLAILLPMFKVLDGF